MQYPKLKYLFFLSSLVSYGCFAHVGINSELPIQITADNASYEHMNHALYQGNVILTQGDHELRADKLDAKKDRDGFVTVITATGNPAHYNGKLTTNPSPVFATAKTIHYYPDKQLVVLEGEATLKHEQDTFHGPTLSYQLEKQIISAVSQKEERPTMIIYPQVSKK